MTEWKPEAGGHAPVTLDGSGRVAVSTIVQKARQIAAFAFFIAVSLAQIAFSVAIHLGWSPGE